MTKYLVSGYIGFDNFGDEAIAHSLVEKLKKGEFYNQDGNKAEKITLISSNPKKTSKIHNVDACKMLNFFKPLLDTDVLISGGGSLLQDVTSIKSLIYYISIIYTALILKKEVYIFAQGIGPINSKISQILTKNALKFCKKITVRDKKSQDLLRDWNIESELVKDPILEIEIPHKNIKGTVGIQLRNYPTVTEKFLDKLADEISQKFTDKKFEIYSLQDSIDIEICENFAKKLRTKTSAKVEVVKNLNVNEVFDRISNLEYMIAMRFHACVVAIKSGVKTLAINYDIKVKNLANEYNMPIIELDQEDISKEFESLL